VEFDRLTVLFLKRGANPPELDDDAAKALQDAHLAFLSSLHEGGQLAAAGPIVEEHEWLRGICLFTVGPEEARALAQRDPKVQQRVLELEVLPWMVPAGAITFARASFPRSVAEAESD